MTDNQTPTESLAPVEEKAPVEKKQGLSEALRSEILKITTEGDPKAEGALTPDILARILRVVKTGRDLLVSLSASPSNLASMVRESNSPLGEFSTGDSLQMQMGSSSTNFVTTPLAYASPQENFGMVALRELIAVAKDHLVNRNSPSPETLIGAIALAREKGLDDLAQKLEEKLGVGEATEEKKSEPEPEEKETS